LIPISKRAANMAKNSGLCKKPQGFGHKSVKMEQIGRFLIEDVILGYRIVGRRR
jgi:hypothetical protein